MSMFIGEALVGDGNEIAHIDLLIGAKSGPVGTAFANALANQSHGHTNLLAVLAPNLICNPATVMITKVTIKGLGQAVQMFGPAQAAVAKAVADSVAAGVLAFGPRHGGDIESCMRFLDAGLTLVRTGTTLQDAAAQVVNDSLHEGQTPPGFGHRFHTRDPRAARLFQMALELELDGEHVRMIRAVERHLNAREEELGLLPVNVDGAIAAICADLGFAYELGHAVFLISRLPGLIAHAHEERTRQKPMRAIDPSDHDYDGARQRRLPESRK